MRRVIGYCSDLLVKDPTFKAFGTLAEDGYIYVNYRFGPNREEIKFPEIIYRDKGAVGVLQIAPHPLFEVKCS